MLTVQQHPRCVRRGLGWNEGLGGAPGLPVVAVQTGRCKWGDGLPLTAPSCAIQPSAVSWNLLKTPC